MTKSSAGRTLAAVQAGGRWAAVRPLLNTHDLLRRDCPGVMFLPA